MYLHDFISGTNAQFDTWQSVLLYAVQKGAEMWFVPIDAVTAMKTISAMQAKKTARKEYEAQ
ncbi:MAG: hypothetical protein LBM07_04310 [Culturomica sp.]|jgi:hypothetical protein|nr:hypothetical protein [Culturomica sp.]